MATTPQPLGVDPAPRPPKSIFFTPLSIVPILLMALGLMAIGFFAAEMWRSPEPVVNAQAPPLQPAAGSPPTLTELERNLKEFADRLSVVNKQQEDRLKFVSEQASRSQWLLSIVLGAAGLLTIAQGIFAFFNAQNYVKQADDAIKRANEAEIAAKAAKTSAEVAYEKGVTKLESIGTEVRANFALLADIQSAAAAAYRRLSSFRGRLDGDLDNVYTKSDPLIRQEFFALEHIAVILSLSPANRSDELIGNLRLLGRFYTGKFVTEKKPGDFDRARYYFDLAGVKSNYSFSTLNDAGWLCGLADRKDEARAAFERSLRQQPEQQRALYNLGTMTYERTDKDKLAASRGHFEQAIKFLNWEESPNEFMTSHLSYNIACCYDSLSSFETDAAQKITLLDASAVNLLAASKVGAQPKKLLDADLSAGDLSNLGVSQLHAGRLKTIREAYQEAWAKRPS